MNQLYKRYRDAFWGKVDALKDLAKQQSNHVAWGDNRKIWPDKLTRSKAIVDCIATQGELRQMVG